MIDMEARMLVEKMQYQADAVTISRDDRFLLCNMGQVSTGRGFMQHRAGQ